MAWHDMKRVLEMDRRPEDILAARHANVTAKAVQQITALFDRPSNWTAGQSSLAAARDEERKHRERFLAALANLRSVAQDCAAATDIPSIRTGLNQFITHVSEAQEDCGLLKDAWSEAIGQSI